MHSIDIRKEKHELFWFGTLRYFQRPLGTEPTVRSDRPRVARCQIEYESTHLSSFKNNHAEPLSNAKIFSKPINLMHSIVQNCRDTDVAV
ncbi:hypothetical protein EDC54_11335 [Samsonia erythrinae]|uniref:Uncharacterized protein n=1 Tax=Samsonia erythrinae TaxID=160434 RepID=A0A4R3VEA2_9GAMM|nr:hypothetical protein EDC54_11335 [Samsonia erythrinae]